MENLKYTATKIATAEKKHNASFFKILEEMQSNPSINGLLFLYNAGGGSDEEFDKEFLNGTDKIMTKILEGLADGGFLSKEAAKQATAEMNKNLS